MMDGEIAAMRQILDENGYYDLPIMGYSAKYASAYYGPFREAAHSAPAFGNRSTYQMDVANGQEALREIAADIDEGADIIMVKPALAFLDVIKEAKLNFNMPICAYNVSGEYAMLKMAVEQGLMKESVIEESLLAIKRAGADTVSYTHLDVYKRQVGFVTDYVKEVPFDSFDGNYAVVVVGPPIMMKLTAEKIMSLGVPEEKIWVSFERKMSCAVGKCGHCRIDETYVCLDGPVFNYTKAKYLVD